MLPFCWISFLVSRLPTLQHVCNFFYILWNWTFQKLMKFFSLFVAHGKLSTAGVDSTVEYYEPKDFMIGENLCILGKKWEFVYLKGACLFEWMKLWCMRGISAKSNNVYSSGGTSFFFGWARGANFWRHCLSKIEGKLSHIGSPSTRSLSNPPTPLG